VVGAEAPGRSAMDTRTGARTASKQDRFHPVLTVVYRFLKIGLDGTEALLNHVRAGDTMVCHSLDRLGRNLTDLRALVTDLTARGVRVEFVKENLAFTGGDSPLQTLLLSMLGSVAEFERALIHERQLEGVALAKAAGRYKGGTPKLSSQRAAQLRERVAAGEPKAALAREFGLTRQTVYNYLAAAEAVPA